MSDLGRRLDGLGETVVGRRGAGLCPRCGSRLDRIRISPGCGTQRGCRNCGSWGEASSSRSKASQLPSAKPFTLRDIIAACPLRAQTVFSAATELYNLIEDSAGAVTPAVAASGGQQAALFTVRGDLATLWVQVDASARPGVAVGVAPEGLDMEEYAAERKTRIVVLCASASREQGAQLLDRVVDLLTPARLKRLRRARDPEAVRRILQCSKSSDRGEP